MSVYERNQVNDTVLSGGLLAVLVAWLALAAAQGPLPLTGTEAPRAAMIANCPLPEAQPAQNAAPVASAAPMAQRS